MKKFTGYAVISVACVLSILSCSFINFLILRKKNLRDVKENRQVVILLTFYILLCMSSLLPYYEEDDKSGDMCDTQGILIQLFSLSGILWTGYIALYRFLDYKGKNEPCNSWITLSIIVLFSLFTSIFPYANEHDEYGQGTTWCWYTSTGSSESDTRLKVFTFLFFYGIAWSVIIWIAFVYTYLTIKFRQMRGGSMKIETFKYFPMNLVICFFPLTISRIYQIVDKDIMIKSDDFRRYFIFSAFTMRMLGFFNAIVYGFNPEIQYVISNAWNYQVKENNDGYTHPPTVSDEVKSNQA